MLNSVDEHSLRKRSLQPLKMVKNSPQERTRAREGACFEEGTWDGDTVLLMHWD